MAIAFTEFDSTPASIVADLKAAVVASSDWANITGDIVKATAPNGAQMVVNLAKAAAGNTVVNLSVWRSHTAGVGTDEKLFYMPWKRTTALPAASTDALHCRVSAGPTHLYMEIEGPRGGEANAANTTTGSGKASFFVGEILSYWDGTTDPTPAVVVVGQYVGTSMTNAPLAYVSRNAAGAVSWVPAYLATLAVSNMSLGGSYAGHSVGLDGKTYLTPWVVWEMAAGIRGRITDAWCAGPIQDSLVITSDPVLSEGQRYTYDGTTFRVMAPVRANTDTLSPTGWQLAWSASNNSSQTGSRSQYLVAIPVA